MKRISFTVKKLSRQKIRSGGRTYYSFRIHIPSRYIKDGHIDPNKSYRVILEEVEEE